LDSLSLPALATLTNVTIDNLDSLLSLDGFKPKAITGHMLIKYNSHLPSLGSAFDSLVTMGSVLIVKNAVLEDISFKRLASAMRIDVKDNPSLLDLGGFPMLDSVAELRIRNNDLLPKLVGFDELKAVARGLDIEYNSKLAEMDAFAKLKQVGHDLVLLSNPLLQSVDFPQLTAILGSLTIENMDGFQGQLKGFERLTTVAQDLTVRYNSALRSLGDRFDELTTLGNLTVEKNALLSDISFAKLATTEWNIDIKDNDALIELGGFPALLAVGGTLRIRNNDHLEVLAGFDALETVGLDLDIEYNSALTTMVHAFGSLNEVGDDMVCLSNSKLEYFNFPSLTSILGVLELDNLDGMTGALGGFDSLTKLGSLRMKYMTNLKSLGSSFKHIKRLKAVKIDKNSGLHALDLSFLEVVDEDLTVAHNSALSIIRMKKLEEVSHELTLRALPSLLEVRMNSLARVRGITIDETSVLQSLTLPSLTLVSGDLTLEDNHMLGPVSMPKLSTIGQDVKIHKNDAMTQLPSLPALTNLGGALTVEFNSALKSFNGAFDRLEQAKDVTVKQNAALGTFSFASLATVQEDLYVIKNSALVDVEQAFPSLKFVGLELRLEENNALAKIGGFPLLQDLGGNVRLGPGLPTPDAFPLLSVDKIRPAWHLLWSNKQAAKAPPPSGSDGVAIPALSLGVGLIVVYLVVRDCVLPYCLKSASKPLLSPEQKEGSTTVDVDAA